MPKDRRAFRAELQASRGWVRPQPDWYGGRGAGVQKAKFPRGEADDVGEPDRSTPLNVAGLFNLPPEVLEERVLLYLTVGECARTAMTCRTLRAAVAAASVAAAQAEQHGHDAGLSLEQLALRLSLDAVENHVYHNGVWADEHDAALILVGAGPVLDALAAILRRHTRARVELHSHISLGNQPFSERVTRLRGEAVRAELEARGVRRVAIGLTAWGDRIAARARWRRLEAARTVFFVSLDGELYPPRPDVYDREAEAEREHGRAPQVGQVHPLQVPQVRIVPRRFRDIFPFGLNE